MQFEMSNSSLNDSRGRVARYLRLSITDRCNLSCFYCRGTAPMPYIPHSRILRYEEMLRFAGIARKQGIRKLRVTGGEPFARKNCTDFLLRLRKEFPDLRICLTSNGTLLEPHIGELRKLALESVNISLDSFKPETYARITGKPLLDAVLGNIDRLLAAGIRVKVNAVALKGITDVQIDDFIHMARQMPVDVRFIEFMPMGTHTLWDHNRFLSCNTLFHLAGEKAKLHPAMEAGNPLAGPAVMHEVEGAKGRLGFISALSNHFCQTCNRLRLTCDGNLRLCLFADKNFRIAPLLRHNNVSDTSIARALTNACARKPLGAEILKNTGRIGGRHMSQIGG